MTTDNPVWLATRRPGVNYHRPTHRGSRRTVCGRPVRSEYGVLVSEREANDEIWAVPCPRCHPATEPSTERERET